MSRATAEPARRLVLLRHGRTAWNAERRAQGHSDVPLGEVGKAQAERVAAYLGALGPAYVRSSDLARARATAERVAAVAGLELTLDDRLREYDLGERTGLTMAEYAAAHPEEYSAFRSGHYDVVPGGETTATVVARVTSAVREALAALAPGDCGLIVGHGGALKVAVVALLGLPPQAVESLQALDNCGWAELQDTGQGRQLRLAAWNRTAPGDPDFTSVAGVG